MWKKLKKALTDPHYLILVAKYRLLYFMHPRLLNDGERYDPQIFGKIRLDDRMHIARYEFAGRLIDADDEVVDIACGTGYGTAILAAKCRQAKGIDISEAAIKFAGLTYGRRKNLSFLCGDLTRGIPQADTIVSFETVEHVDADPRDTIKKLQAASRKKLIVSVPYREKPGRNPHHRHFHLDENIFYDLADKNHGQFFYQDQSGAISATKTADVQNLLMVWTH